jgi:hypothetical protein
LKDQTDNVTGDEDKVEKVRFESGRFNGDILDSTCSQVSTVKGIHLWNPRLK